MSQETRSMRETMRMIYFFGGIFILIIAMNAILAHLFKLPFKFHFALFPAAIVAFYIHFILLCEGDGRMLPDEGLIPYIEGRGKLLIPIYVISLLILKLIPRIRNQTWHKHRALLIVGPFCLALCLGLTLALHIRLSGPIFLMAALSILASYYAPSFLPRTWANISN